MNGLICTHANSCKVDGGYACPDCSYTSPDGHVWGFYRRPSFGTSAPIPEPKGRTANALRECMSNLALGKRVYYVVHSTQFIRYCESLLRHIAHLRGFPECRMKSETEFALKNGGATLKFVSYGDSDSILRIRNLNRASDAVVFYDNHAWAGRRL